MSKKYTDGLMGAGKDLKRTNIAMKNRQAGIGEQIKCAKFKVRIQDDVKYLMVVMVDHAYSTVEEKFSVYLSSESLSKTPLVTQISALRHIKWESDEMSSYLLQCEEFAKFAIKEGKVTRQFLTNARRNLREE